MVTAALEVPKLTLAATPPSSFSFFWAPEFGSGRYRGARPTRGARVAACQKITMALAMGYMLLTML